ncbi:hypothetical protein ACFQ1M_15340 [Sungkyunkwania multivorans]|uniref:7(1) septoil knot domain-containing protein n=1 Tax=Sungkyunkwania multivorans TaxID=1173618 RepID=A0ABW3D1Y1_9FLAO
MKYFLHLALLIGILNLGSNMFTMPSNNSDKDLRKLDSCYFEGRPLYGKIKLVENKSQADVTVKIVSSFPDLKVKFVEHFADDCGEWQIVEHGEDLRVYITENFEDIKVKPVSSFPGLN